MTHPHPLASRAWGCLHCPSECFAAICKDVIPKALQDNAL